MIYRCCDLNRRDLVDADALLNGIDYLEVVDGELPALDPLRQRTLLVHCLKPLPAGFSAANLQLAGGERVRNIAVDWAAVAQPLPAALGTAAEAATAAVVQALSDADRTLVVRTKTAGDFSTYKLRFVASPLSDAPPPNFDPRLRDIEFSFKVECPSDFDCAPQSDCPAPDTVVPDIDYLAKDYASFRRLLLDRLAQQLPDWRQTSVADTGVALTELLAYAADRLSYQQDAVATEAYLNTARKRVSLRRHALMVDYRMHDGCNARSWLQLQIAQASYALPLDAVRFLSRCPGFATGIEDGSARLDAALQLQPLVYEPLLDPRYAPAYRQPLHAAHNAMSFHTWSDARCCLPAGATQATLRGHYPDLQIGDALLFEEVLGPLSGESGDADPAHRHVLRLTAVDATQIDPLGNWPITEIAWAPADALPFPLCISGQTDARHGGQPLSDISLARGNLVLVDHGHTLDEEPLGSVPPATVYLAPDRKADRCTPQTPSAVPPRYRPQLAQAPLTQASGSLIQTAAGAWRTQPAGFDSYAPALQALSSTAEQALPQLALRDAAGALWQSRRTLLSSAAAAHDFVVEIDEAGVAALRFGDDAHGQRPDSGTAFDARYRTGNGTAGNIGADRIVHLVAAGGELPNVLAVRNPLPASGGTDAETAASVRRNAPQAFRTQQRAVTTADYAEVTQRNPQVQRAAAGLRWTGSWHTAFITVDPLAGIDSGPLKDALLPFVDRYRMAGQDLHFDDPQYVSLELALHVCVKDGYFRSDIRQRLLQQLGNRRLADGRRGLFHPDNFSFGQSVFLSPIYAAAHAIPGVASVQVVKFQRQGSDDPRYLLSGELPLARLEIARLDNDRNYPEHGVLRLDIHGGQ